MRPPKLQVEQTINMGPPSFFWFLLISLSLTGTGSLRVEMGESPVKSLRNKEAIIPCTISDWGPGDMNLPKLSVQWTQRLLNGSDEVYLYVSGTHTRTRPGSYISDSEIIRGNVALHLPRVQFTDEGEYTCTVFYTPNKVVGKSALQVSAPPTASLTPTDITIESGMEKTVVCEATGFYPEDIRFEWVKHLSDSRNVVLKKEVSYSHPIENEDETYNQISFLRINPTLEDNGNIYSCNVSHRSMETDLHFNLTLSVTEPNNKGLIINRALLGVSIAVFLLGLCGYIYMMFYKKVALKLSAITGAEDLVHMNRATLSCQISGFRPKPIRITLWLKRNGGEEMEIDSWDSETQTGSSAPVSHHREEQRVVIVPEREGLMRNGTNLPPAQRPLRVEMVNIIITSKFQHISNCQCTIHITPDIEEDDGAELTVRVTHSALRLPISKSCKLEVTGIQPKISKIVSPLRILQGESLTLTCPIYGFKPKPLSVTWLKVDSNGRETKLLHWDRGTTMITDSKYLHELAEYEREEEEEDDYLNYFLSNLTLKPTVKGDHGTRYICRTHHYATGQRAQKNMVMEVSAVPELDPIETPETSEIQSAGKETTLSCRIHSFHPQPLEVSWYKEDEELPSHNDPILTDDNGLFYCTSCITYSPCVRDIGKKFRCEVSQPSLQNPKCVSWELKHLISMPLISEIQCDPEVPEFDQPVTLSCTVRDFYPETCTIRWYKGRKSISPANDTEPAQQDPESGLFSKTTQMIFTPTIGQHGTEYHLEITHSMKTTIRTYHLKLKGFPEIKEITCNQNPPKYGVPLTLSCEVIGCEAHDVTAEWRLSGEPTVEEMTSETQINTNSVSFTLKLTPTAEHCGKVVSCWVKRRGLQQPLKKNHLLKLPDVPPTLSEIMVFPKDLLLNKEAIFKINISGFSQRKLGVKWFRFGKELTEHVETSEPEIGLDGLYSCSSSVRFTPTYKDLIQCQVVTNKGTYSKMFQLKSRGFDRHSQEPKTI